MRAATALAVAVMATLGAMHLFSVGIGRSSGNLRLAQYLGGRVTQTVHEAADSARPAPQPIVIETTLERSKPVSTVLEEAGLKRGQARWWERLFRRTARTSVLSRGHELVIYRDPNTGDLRGLRYDMNDRTSVIERALGYGVVMASTEEIPYVIHDVSVAFSVKNDFTTAARRHGVPASVVGALENAFDRARNALRPGAGVKVVYQERVARDGSHTLPDAIQAAQVDVGTSKLTAIAFRDPHGGEHLYNAAGRALGQQFLRYPLNFQYISSGFSFHRYHPILHIYRPHLGVDLAARYGTPVKAIADGSVEYAGWCGELGRCVRLEHEHGLVSLYGHLSRFSEAAYTGDYVRMGEVIGYVGESGLATGPHLHFAIEREGRFVNPLTQHLAIAHRISPRMKPLFNRVKRRDLAELAMLPDVGSHFVPVADRKPAISRYAAMYHVEPAMPQRATRRHRRWRWHHHHHRHPRVASETNHLM